MSFDIVCSMISWCYYIYDQKTIHVREVHENNRDDSLNTSI